MQNNSMPPDAGGILVDHGPKLAAADEALFEVARQYQEATGAPIVEPSHMELAEPTIAQAFARGVEQAARVAAVHPYFLSRGPS